MATNSAIQIDINASNNASPVLRQVADDAQGLETSINGLGARAGGAAEGLGLIEVALQALGIVMAGLTVGVEVFQKAFEWGELAAGNERLIESGRLLAQSYGSSMDEIVAKVKEASLGTVSEMDIIASANKAMMLGVTGDADQLANLMEIAAFRARAMGISTAQAFDDIARGIGRTSPMILDNLGIVVDADSTYSKYAESIGKSTSELDKNEKIQALLTRVIEEGNAQLEEAGGLVEDNAASYERWNAELENTKNFLLEDTIEMSRFADMGADLLETFVDLGENGIGFATGQLNPFELAMEFAEKRVVKMNEELGIGNESLRSVASSMGDAKDATQELGEAQEEVNGIYQVAIEINADVVKGAMNAYQEYERQQEKLEQLRIKHDELNISLNNLIAQGVDPTSSQITSLTQRLQENEEAQRKVTEAINESIEAQIMKMAYAGLDAEGTLALARATGQISEEAYAALRVMQDIKDQYQSGALTANEYAEKTVELQRAIDTLQDKNITITVSTIFETIGEMPDLPSSGYSTGTEGWMTVPSGYPNDTYPVMLSSGERFAVIPEGTSAAPMTGGGMGVSGGTVNFYMTMQSAVSVADEHHAQNVIFPFVEEAVSRLKAEGKL